MPGRQADRRRRAAASPAAPGPELALEIATRFLATRPRSRWEVERRLVRAGTDEETRRSTLERLAQLGLLDDTAFARWWVEQRDRHAPRGQRMIEAELRQHGIGQDVIAILREDWASPSGSGGQEGTATGGSEPEIPFLGDEERAQISLTHHLRGRPLPTDAKALQRLAMYLVRRGFTPEAARTALRVAEAERSEAAASDLDGPA